MAEGEPTTITVGATDATGDLADLLYSFDCDGDGVFEVAHQSGSSAACVFPDGPADVIVERDRYLRASKHQVHLSGGIVLPAVDLLGGDTNGDQMIDLDDIATAAKNMGKSGSPWN